MAVYSHKMVIFIGIILLLSIFIYGESETTPPLNLNAITAIYPLDNGALSKLYQNKFIVLKNQEKDYLSGSYFGLFEHYNVSVFITSDAMLHIFHNVHDEMLKEIEKQHLYQVVEDLAKSMQPKSMDDYTTTSESFPLLKEAAKRNVIFFTVCCRLLDDTFPIPEYVQTEVNNYVNKILAHNATEFYPGDDYTQYKPRGHYEGDSQLEKYFRCMKWLGRRIFRIKDFNYPEDSDIELGQAVMIARILEKYPSDLALWQKFYNVTTLLAGNADSITPLMVSQAVKNVFPIFSIEMLESTENLEKLRQEFEKPDYPESEIIPVPLQYPGQIPSKYIQFFGERYVPDSYVFQQVSFPYIGDASRMPSGLEILATMLDSHRADSLLTDEKSHHPNLAEQMEMLNDHFTTYTLQDWTRTVYNNWFYVMKPLLVEFGNGYPEFMRSNAWYDEKINTCLASWTQLRHDYILYAAQTYIPMPAAEGYGYVEPIPEFYSRLADLCNKIRNDLNSQGVLPSVYNEHLGLLAAKLMIFKGYAEKILAGIQLSNGEQIDIHEFGLWLLGFFAGEGLKEKKPVLVADVCTNSLTEQVLHEGVGKFNPIIVIYQQPDGKVLAGIGYVMSHYEFLEEEFNRLSDSEWEEKVDTYDLPLRPSWVLSYLYPEVFKNIWIFY